MEITNKKAWTNEQQKVIDTRGVNLLVSASAGSGKTTVMLERVKKIIENGEADITQILVVTFTNAAAEDMRNKLEEKLEELAIKNPNIKEQIENMELSDISTLHSFCQKLIRANFYAVGVDPSFSVIDETDSNFLKNEALNKLLGQYYKKEDEVFSQLLESFNSKRNDKKFKAVVLNLYSFIRSQSDSISWLKDIACKGYNTDLEASESALVLIQELFSIVDSIKQEFIDLIEEAQKYDCVYLTAPLIDKYKYLSEIELKKSYKEIFDFLKQDTDFVRLMANKFEVNSVQTEIYEKVKVLNDKFNEKVLKNIREIICLNADSYETLQNNLMLSEVYARKLADFTLEFSESYQQLKKTENVLDFEDLEHYALQILKNSDINAALKNKYKYIFVDEYQDINGIQEEIINLLCHDNNLFMVGDIKQSIYGFRQCDPDIFADKYKLYEQGGENNEKIDLNHNFRSDKYILWFANSIFSKIMTEKSANVNYAKNALFVPKMEYGDSDYPIVNIKLIDKVKQPEVSVDFNNLYKLSQHSNTDEKTDIARVEGQIIASEIIKLLDSKIEDKKIDYSDIVILVRSGGLYLEKICDELSKLNIPVTAQFKDNIFDSPEVQFLNSMLEIIDNQNQDIPLLAVMRSQIFEFTDTELSKIKLAFSGANPLVKNSYFYEVCDWYKLNIKDDISQKLNAFYKKIDEYRQKLKYLSLEQLLKDIVASTSLLNLSLAMPNGAERANNINLFINSFKNMRYNFSLPKYIEYISSFDLNINSSSLGGTKSVRVMTMHKSKGLEHPVIFLAGMGREFNSKSLKEPVIMHKKFGIGMKHYDPSIRYMTGTLARKACEIAIKKDSLAEEMRVMYVALTRAKNHLIIVGGADVKKSLINIENYKAQSYIDWILVGFNESARTAIINRECEYDFTEIDGNTISKNGVHISVIKEDEEIIDKQNALGRNVIFNKPDAKYLKKIQDSFEYSYPNKESAITPLKNTVTALMSNKDTEFVYNNLISENDADDAAIKGTAYHKVMQYVDFNNETESITNIAARGLISEQEISYINPDEINKCKNILKDMILSADKIYKEQQFLMYAPYNEINLGSKITDSVLIQGVADLVLIKDGTATIVDYKTTKGTAEKLIKKYYTQLSIYARATSDALNINVKQAFIYSFYLNSLIKVF